MQLAETRSPKSYYAELEAVRFSRSELYEILAIWFPRTAAFAVMRGGFSSVVPQDKAMDIVGQFFVRLTPENKERWNAFFTGSGTLRERAMTVGMGRTALWEWKNGRMEELANDLP
jgi:hypothetical protein